MFSPDLLESFRQLAATGRVEFLNQTYYHSIASLYPETDEFVEQISMHHNIVKSLLCYEPKVFENTKLLYNNAIAKTVDSLGYRGIYTEGVEKILGDKSPNFILHPERQPKHPRTLTQLQTHRRYWLPLLRAMVERVAFDRRKVMQGGSRRPTVIASTCFQTTKLSGSITGLKLAFTIFCGIFPTKF